MIIYGIAAFAVVRFGLIVLAMAGFTANVLLTCRTPRIFRRGMRRMSLACC